jgi:N-acetylmuramoyl-L-alanine amidase
MRSRFRSEPLNARVAHNISAMLCAVRNSIFSRASFWALGCAILLLPPRPTDPPQQDEPQSTVQPTPVPPAGPVVVLDPAHGGTDTGARGEGGVAEKDIVLQMARTVREQLLLQGYRVVLTRKDDSNPSYDDRAAAANAYRDAVFVSLHVSSTGAPGTVRAYYDQFSAAIPSQPSATLGIKPPTGLVVWDQAQRPYLDVSRRLADFMQSQLARSFPGSSAQSTAAAVRTLRSITAPSVAIEISSISASTRDSLVGAAGPLSSAISQGVSALRQFPETGAR